jgi:hypothetical protein
MKQRILMRVGMFVLAWWLNLGAADTFAQTASGADGSASQNPSPSGNSTAAASSESTPATNTSGNATPLTPEMNNLLQLQQQQLTNEYAQKLAAAAPEDRAALTARLQSLLNNLAANLPPPGPPAAADPQALINAQLQAYAQSLPAETQQTIAAVQQRQRIIDRLNTATPDQKAALLAQLQQLSAPSAQTSSSSNSAPANGTDASSANATVDTQIAAAVQAPLPTDQQSVPQALAEHQLELEAALHLPPEQQAAALQAVQAEPLPAAATSSVSTANSGSVNSTTATISLNSQSSTQP